MNDLMIVINNYSAWISIYSMLAVLWSAYAVYQHWSGQKYDNNSIIWCLILNFLFCPICIGMWLYRRSKKGVISEINI